jgi:hypothetical protein
MLAWTARFYRETLSLQRPEVFWKFDCCLCLRFEDSHIYFFCLIRPGHRNSKRQVILRGGPSQRHWRSARPTGKAG